MKSADRLAGIARDLLHTLNYSHASLFHTLPEEMSREDMKRFVQYLDKRGVFTVTKSGTKICNMLNISKYTLYKYLGHGSKGGQGSEDDT